MWKNNLIIKIAAKFDEMLQLLEYYFLFLILTYYVVN